jgi:DNA-binding CsgD family transcriptional regulator
MKNSAGIAKLRALCRAGLGGEMFIPAALEALHAVVPSYRNLFDWCDKDGNLVRYYFEGPVDARIAALYFEEFYNRRESEVMPHFRHAVRADNIIRTAAQLDTPAFFRSALYNEIWRPQGLHTRLEAIVRTPQGRTLGSLVLYRAPGEPRFNAEDERMLERATAYIAAGLMHAESGATKPIEFCASPMARAAVVLDGEGRLAQLTADALKLLMLSHGGVTPQSVARAPRREDFTTLDSMWQHHRRGDARERASRTVENDWGRFTFDAEPMWPVCGSHPPSLEVAITRYEPRVVFLQRSLDRLPLSPTQRDVCERLHEGESQAQIARKLNVAPTTVADHVRKIYTKLGVHSAMELRDLLSPRA